MELLVFLLFVAIVWLFLMNDELSGDLSDIKKECVERGVAHYNSDGEWDWNQKPL